MLSLAAPSPNFIWGGYRPGRVWSGRGSAFRQSFGISGFGGGDRVGRGRRAGLDRVKGKALQPRRIETAVFCGFRRPASRIVTGSPVTGSAETAVSRALRGARRLIDDYAAAPAGAIEADQAARRRSAGSRGGRPPFAARRSSTPLAHSAAGAGEKFQAGPVPPLLTLPASPGRANTAAADGVGVRVDPALARAGRNDAEKTGPGAGDAPARTLTARGIAAAGVGAGDAMVQGGGRPFGVKGAAMLCAPGLRVN